MEKNQLNHTKTNKKNSNSSESNDSNINVTSLLTESKIPQRFNSIEEEVYT